MAIKFEKLQPGMRLLDVRRHKMGNTTLSEWGWWTVEILSINAAKQCATVRWNNNSPTEWPRHWLEKLYTKLPKAARDQEERRKSR